MNKFYSDVRKIDPAKGDKLGDNTPNEQNRIEIGPTQLAFKEWEKELRDAIHWVPALLKSIHIFLTLILHLH